jgi:hypothetical protein
MMMVIATALNVVALYMVILVALVLINVLIAVALISIIRIATAHIEFTVTNVAKILQLE